MTKNVIFAVGGTGGHLIPAQVAAKEWLAADPTVRIQFLGASLKQCRFFDSSKFDSLDIPSTSLNFNKPLKWFKAAWSLLKGTWLAYNVFKQRAPCLVVGFGSYHSFPVVLAAVIKKIPLVLVESNIYPGQVNRYFAKFAKAVVVPYSECRKYLKDPVVQARMPLRQLKDNSENAKQNAAEYFELDVSKPTLLVCGGSQGARPINTLAKESLEMLADRGYTFQVIHLCGRPSEVKALQDAYKRARINAVVKPFENMMHHAYALASLVICRAGAMTLYELIEFEVPAIMIPFPKAKENHQDKNASYFVEHVAGGIKLKEELATPEKLLALLFEILSNREKTLENFQTHISEFKATLPSKSIVTYLQGCV